MPTGWIVGADGESSTVRKWAGLDATLRDSRRFGFRRHYRMEPWSDYMELYWGDACQVYVTPVAVDSVCVTAISRDPQHRLDDALRGIPELERRLDPRAIMTAERGAVTSSRALKAVYRDRVALVGDASGSVDAITGEGLCVAFRQADALAEAIESGALAEYQRKHRRIARRPEIPPADKACGEGLMPDGLEALAKLGVTISAANSFPWMAKLLLALGDHPSVRRAAMRTMSSHPKIFAKMLALHVGALYETNHSDCSDGNGGAVWAGDGVRARSSPNSRPVHTQ